ncbi:MAG: hypothetical protein HN350_20760, partial [Phycisphaerales bacterium]|nr:hypothetical protein [Phycisphaerales bacterium]
MMQPGHLTLVCAIMLCSNAASLVAAGNTPLLLEGFEKFAPSPKTTNVKIVTSGPGLTQGAAAVELTPGGAITIKVSGADIARLPWLRIDTHHNTKGTRSLQISAASGVLPAITVEGYVATGQDTLAFPLTMRIAPATVKPDTRIFAVTVTNTDTVAIIVDNIRLEPLVRTPPGAILWDFGKSPNTVWPGFTPKSAGSKSIKWKKDLVYHSGHSLPYPDPLTQDCIGAYSS